MRGHNYQENGNYGIKEVVCERAASNDAQFIREPNFLPPSESLSLAGRSWSERSGGEAISCDVVKEKCAARSARAQFSHYYFSLFDARAMEKFVISFSVSSQFIL